MSEENNALNKKQMTEQRNVANNAKNVQVAADIAAKSGNPYAVAAGKAVKVADKISGGKASENIGKTINNLNKMNGIQGKMMQGALNKMGESGALNRLRAAQDKKNSGLSSIFGGKKNSEGIKEPSELSNDTSENDDKPAEGMVNFKIPKSVKKGILYASPFLALIIVFSCLFIAASQTYLNVIGLDDANKSSAQIDDEIYNSTDEEKNQEIKDEDATVYNYNITINKKKYASSYFLVNANSLKKTNNGLNLSDLKDHYGDSADMKTVNKFFVKLNDIYTRYSIKQHVYLDLPLIMSTLTIQSKDMDYVFKSNTSEKYDRKDIETVDTHILDYTHDWTGYKITADNSAHDIEILAQNMVSADANGNYYIDYEKYDEFLKEFLEKKYFIKGGGVYNGTPDIVQTPNINKDGNYVEGVEYTDSSFGQIIYFNQGDYKKYYYAKDTSKPEYGKATISSHGCGPTSLSIVASSILNKQITPIETTSKVCKANGCTSSGSRYTALVNVGKDYGLKVTTTANNQEVINALSTNNSLVIVLMGPGTFTSGGHFIVLTGANTNGQVSVADPASRKRTEKKWFSFNTIVEQRKTYAPYMIFSR